MERPPIHRLQIGQPRMYLLVRFRREKVALAARLVRNGQHVQSFPRPSVARVDNMFDLPQDRTTCSIFPEIASNPDDRTCSVNGWKRPEIRTTCSIFSEISGEIEHVVQNGEKRLHLLSADYLIRVSRLARTRDRKRILMVRTAHNVRYVNLMIHHRSILIL